MSRRYCYYNQAIKITDVQDLGDVMINQLTDLLLKIKKTLHINYNYLISEYSLILLGQKPNGTNIDKAINNLLLDLLMLM